MDIFNACDGLLYTVIFLIAIPILLKLYFKHAFSYWKKRNVPYFEPKIPLGNITLSFNRKYGQDLAEIYRKFKELGVRYGGFFMSVKPVFMSIDPEITRLILAKDFTSFDDRGLYVDEEKEPITAHLFALSGQRWKNLRAKISPTMSASKIKLMYQTMTQCGANLELAVGELTKSDKPIDVRDLCCRYTIDVVGSIGFGVECCSLKDPSAEFLKYGKLMFKNSMFESLKVLLGVTWPKVLRVMNWKFIKPACANFFTSAIEGVVAYREKNDVERNDLVSLLMRLMNKKDLDDGTKTIAKEESITMNELIAQCFVVYMAGFETSATTMSYCMLELAQNAELQQKLREEIYLVSKKYNGQLSYEAVTEMPLLDKIISETMRKYAPVVVLNRICTKDFTIPETNVTIAKGTYVVVPVYGIHYDPEFYPEPEKFDPERFSEEEKRKRPAYTYLPFGEGPRICLGMRLGLTQTKLGVARFIANYEYSVHPDTKLPLEFNTEVIVLSHYGTVWLQAKKI